MEFLNSQANSIKASGFAVFGILWALPELGQCGDWEKLIVKTENSNSHQVSVAHMDIVDC